MSKAILLVVVVFWLQLNESLTHNPNDYSKDPLIQELQNPGLGDTAVSLSSLSPGWSGTLLSSTPLSELHLHISDGDPGFSMKFLYETRTKFPAIPPNCLGMDNWGKTGNCRKEVGGEGLVLTFASSVTSGKVLDLSTLSLSSLSGDKPCSLVPVRLWLASTGRPRRCWCLRQA